MPAKRSVPAVAAALLSGCITTTVVNIGQKSSLERQLMGEIEPLSESELLVASVRAPGGVGSGSADDLTAAALAGRRRQLFNRDDLDELKTAGCLGEAQRARHEARPCDRVGAADNAKLVERLVAEENEDRAHIIDWALSVDPVLTRGDRAQVEEIYHRLLIEKARPGDWVQQEDGAWLKR